MDKVRSAFFVSWKTGLQSHLLGIALLQVGPILTCLAGFIFSILPLYIDSTPLKKQSQQFCPKISVLALLVAVRFITVESITRPAP